MVISEAKRVIELEIEALRILLDKIDESFEGVVKLIKKSKGRVIVTGVGKSGHIGRKIAATLASTGTPAFFIHAAEAAHGDLGMITKSDVCIVISCSGETAEVLNIISPIKQIGVRLIALTGKLESTLAKNCDITLDIGAHREACPLGLAPTCSAVATLAMGDALAIALSVEHGFTKADFARFHPGGSLGKQLREESNLPKSK